METRVEIGDLFVLTLHVLEPQRQRRLLLCTFADLKKPLSSDGFRDRPFYHDRGFICLGTWTVTKYRGMAGIPQRMDMQFL